MFSAKDRPNRQELIEAFQASGAAIEQFLSDLSRGFKRGFSTTLSYFVAHESHHRGSILLTIKTCGHKLDKASSYAIWDWDRA